MNHMGRPALPPYAPPGDCGTGADLNQGDLGHGSEGGDTTDAGRFLNDSADLVRQAR